MSELKGSQVQSSVGFFAVTWGIIVLSALVLALTHVLARRRADATRNEDARRELRARRFSSDRADPLAQLRSPYKQVPLCARCLSVRQRGRPAQFMCRMGEGCGLIEKQPVL